MFEYHEWSLEGRQQFPLCCAEVSWYFVYLPDPLTLTLVVVYRYTTNSSPIFVAETGASTTKSEKTGHKKINPEEQIIFHSQYLTIYFFILAILVPPFKVRKHAFPTTHY